MKETNWAGNVVFGAASFERPSTVDEVRRLVADATARGRRVRALGSRHSFNELAASKDVLIDTTGVASASGSAGDRVQIDADRATVRVGPSVRYGELADGLHRAGWAVHNLPSLPQVTVVGATATGTHGSGDGNGSLSTSVRALTLVTATGDLVTIDATAEPERSAGAVVHLGALGIVTEVEIAIEPTFDVAQFVVTDLAADVVLADFDAVMGSAYSVSLFTDFAASRRFTQCWRKVRLDRPEPAELPAVLAADAAEVQTVDLHPIAALAADACTPQRCIPGPWSERLAHFRSGFTPSSGDELQSEYFVARADAPAALDAVFALADVLAPLVQVAEVRSVRRDDLWLSGAYGRDTIGVHLTWIGDQTRVEQALPLLEEALAPFRPRPHWAKLSAMAPAAVRAGYERFGDFVQLVDGFDPTGTFRNDHLDRLFTG